MSITKPSKHDKSLFYLLASEAMTAGKMKVDDKLLDRQDELVLGNGMKSYVVDGSYVRNYLDVGFIYGGHWLVYPSYVPNNEIWIDSETTVAEQRVSLYHEFVEIIMMMYEKWSYDKSHDIACILETIFRHDTLAANKVVFRAAMKAITFKFEKKFSNESFVDKIFTQIWTFKN